MRMIQNQNHLDLDNKLFGAKEGISQKRLKIMKTFLQIKLIWIIPFISCFLGEILLAYKQPDLDRLTKTRKCIGCDFRDADFSIGSLLNPILGISDLLGSEQRRENFLGALFAFFDFCLWF